MVERKKSEKIESTEALATDIQWLKQEQQKNSEKIDKIYETFTAGEGKIHRLNKKVFGNGEKGLVEQVCEHQKFLDEFRGVINFLKWVGIGNIVAIIAIIIKVFVMA